jgi:hypothetical protein
VENGRRRRASLVVAGLGAIAIAGLVANAEGCSTESPTAGPGGNGGPGRGGVGGSVGGAGAGGGAIAGSGSGGMAVGGAGGAACQLPAGTPGAWEEIAAPAGQANLRITDAFAVGPNDLYFAGKIADPTGATDPTEARILRWTQGCWAAELTIPKAAGPIDFPSVHGLGPNDVWAAASDVLYHRDAQGWTRFANEGWRAQARPSPFGGGSIELNRVRAAAPNVLWVAATRDVLRWDGQAWTAYNFDDPTYPDQSAAIGFYFHTIWIDSPTSVWVGGASDQVGNTMDLSFMHHFDGANWTHAAITLGEVEAIWRGGSVLWLANPAPMFTMQRFDGTTAMDVPMLGSNPNNLPAMVSLFGRGASDLWAAGNDVAHFDGQSWSLVAGAPAAARAMSDDHNTYVTGDAGAVWLATPGPRFFRRVAGP